MVLDWISLNFIKFSSSITTDNYAAAAVLTYKTVIGFVKPVLLKGQVSSSVNDVMIIKCINIQGNIIWVSISSLLIKTSSFLNRVTSTLSKKVSTMIRKLRNSRVNKNKIKTINLYLLFQWGKIRNLPQRLRKIKCQRLESLDTETFSQDFTNKLKMNITRMRLFLQFLSI